jgi:hypothetical protein
LKFLRQKLLNDAKKDVRKDAVVDDRCAAGASVLVVAKRQDESSFYLTAGLF